MNFYETYTLTRKKQWLSSFSWRGTFLHSLSCKNINIYIIADKVSKNLSLPSHKIKVVIQRNLQLTCTTQAPFHDYHSNIYTLINSIRLTLLWALPSLNLLCHSRTDARWMQDGRQSVWSIPYVSVVAFFPNLKQKFIAYRSSKEGTLVQIAILKFTSSDNQA